VEGKSRPQQRPSKGICTDQKGLRKSPREGEKGKDRTPAGAVSFEKKKKAVKEPDVILTKNWWSRKSSEKGGQKH